jgi:hypothetical protein
VATDHLNLVEPARKAWRAESIDQLREQAGLWLRDANLKALARAIGGLDDASAHTHESLRAWSHTHLDTRANNERRQAPVVTIDENLRPRLLQAANTLGLLATAPASAVNHQVIVILGGATTGNALRSALAAEVARTRPTAALVGLTSDRRLTQSEFASDPDSTEDRVEWRNLLRQIQQAFGPVDPDPVVRDHPAGDRRYTTRDGRSVQILVARDPAGRRPNTAQQLSFFCRRTPTNLRESVVLVTNAIYAPYQFFSGASVLLQHASQYVELIGTDTQIDPSEATFFQRIAQEINSGILATTAVLAD